MNRKILAAASMLVAGSAAAQTSVTLYGIADVGIEYANHQVGGGNSVVRVSSGNLAGSRWGLRGTEDLGRGLKALFSLESGFDIDTGKSGQGNRLFGRQAFVGLQHQYGTLTLGRHIAPFYEFGVIYDPMIIAPKYGLLTQDIGFVGRADNSVKYTGNFGGWTAVALYSTGADSNVAGGSEVPGNSKLGREYSGRISYDGGPFSVGVVYDETNVGTVTSNPDAKLRRASVAGLYVIGNARAYVGYRWARGYDGATLQGAQTGNGNQGSNLYWAGLQYQLTSALSMAAAAYYQDFKNTGSDPWLFSALLDYTLSKRTDLYAAVGYTKNKGNSSLGLSAGASGFGNTNPGTNQFGATVGIRHKF